MQDKEEHLVILPTWQSCVPAILPQDALQGCTDTKAVAMSDSHTQSVRLLPPYCFEHTSSMVSF